MNRTEELKARMVAAGEKLREKGWKSASLDLGAHYLAVFDRPPSPYDPMLAFTASIRSNSPHNYVRGFSFESMEEAIAALEHAADEMPSFAEEKAKRESAFSKL